MLLVSLLLLWLAIAKSSSRCCCAPIGFGGLLSNIPEAGMALTALERSLLAHHDAGQLAVIAREAHCAPDVHAEALALALPSVQSQMESGGGHGLHAGRAGAVHKGGIWLRRRAAGHLYGRRRDDGLDPRW
ncbi:hypothetical protein KCP76_13770 [Salmonella enterica subsp. enterica serovar Weltevreden]|nr:hypothetical protein KCP76_13770 [Salmonella enterica subsp. enterica serovar Weltevreden]